MFDSQIQKQKHMSTIIKILTDNQDMTVALFVEGQMFLDGTSSSALLAEFMKTEQKYVVGFMFDESMSNVALIRKNKPAWQAGLLNGIGGKIEADETAAHAMAREFAEEACGYGGEELWRHFCSMDGTNNDGSSFCVEFFFTIGEPHKLTSMEDEQIEVVPSADIAAWKEKTIGNLPWLVALAVDFGKGVHPPSHVTAKYSANTELSDSRPMTQKQ